MTNKLKDITLNPYNVNWWLSFVQDRMQRVVEKITLSVIRST